MYIRVFLCCAVLCRYIPCALSIPVSNLYKKHDPNNEHKFIITMELGIAQLVY
jgi:hypothetical protein